MKMLSYILITGFIFLITACTTNPNKAAEIKNDTKPSENGTNHNGSDITSTTIDPITTVIREPFFSASYLLSLFANLDFSFPSPIPNYPFVDVSNQDISYTSTWAGSSYDGSTSMNLQSAQIGGMTFLPNGDLQVASGIWSEVGRLNMRYKANGTPGNGLPILNQYWFVLGSNLITSNSSSIYIGAYVINNGGNVNGDIDCYPAVGKAWVSIIKYNTADPAVPVAMPGGKNCFGVYGGALFVIQEVPFPAYSYDMADKYIGGLAADDSGHLAVSFRQTNTVAVYNTATMQEIVLPHRRLISNAQSNLLVSHVENAVEYGIVSEDLADDIIDEDFPSRFSVINPGPVAFVKNTSGIELAVISNQVSVQRYSLTNGRLNNLPLPNVSPISLASYNNELLVATGKNDNRMYLFKTRKLQPIVLAGTYGNVGGYKSLPVPGVVGHNRLSSPRAIALNAGRVAYSGDGSGGSLLFTYSRETRGTLNLHPSWEANAETLIATGHISGDNCDKIMSSNQIHVKKSGITQSGRDWKRVALTTDFDRFPEDYRKVISGAGPVEKLQIWDPETKKYRTFMVYVSQAGNNMIFYKYLTGVSEILEPSTFMAIGNSQGLFKRPELPIHPNCSAVDAWWCAWKGWYSTRPDADGKYSTALAEHETPSLQGYVDYSPWEVVTLSVSKNNATVVVPGGYISADYGYARFYPLQGFDSNGNPKYTYETSFTKNIQELKVVERVIYDDTKDEIYVMGYETITEALTKTWGMAGLKIYKYKNILSNEPLELIWNLTLPEAVQSPYFAIKSISLTNGLLFAGILASTPDQAVYVVNAEKGTLVGTVGRNATWNAAFDLEWIDSSAGVNSCYDEKNNRYTMTAEGLNGLLDIFYIKY